MKITIDGVVRGVELEQWEHNQKTAFALVIDNEVLACTSQRRVGDDPPMNGQRVRVTGEWTYVPGARGIAIISWQPLK